MALVLALMLVAVQCVAAPRSFAASQPQLSDVSTQVLQTPKAVSLKLKAVTLSKKPGKKSKLKVTYRKNGNKVSKAKVKLQIKKAGRWVTKKSIRVLSGRATVHVAAQKTRTYRVKVGTHHSKPLTIKKTKATTTQAPTSFLVTGSGYGHGVGMSQYGAYQLAREGKSASDILQHYFAGTKVVATTMPETIAVQIFGPEPYGFSGYADSANSTTFRISAGNWQIVDDDNQVLFPKSGTAGSDSSAKITLSGKKVSAKISGARNTTVTNTHLVFRWSGTDEYLPNATKAVASVGGAHGSYRHGQLIASAISGRLNIVNELDLRDYLYGIAEMPSSWGLTKNKGRAALSAQAITARSYALVKMAVSAQNPDGKLKSACLCHLVDDVRDQYFNGWNKENETVGSTNYGAVWRSAVDATIPSSTTAHVLTYNGTVISTYYFSSSGGATANSEDVWSAQVPYLRSVADPQSLQAPGNTMTTWQRSIPSARLAQIFGLTDVVRIKVTERYSSGQAKTLRAYSSDKTSATYSAKADVIRARLGSLPSAWITSFKAQ